MEINTKRMVCLKCKNFIPQPFRICQEKHLVCNNCYQHHERYIENCPEAVQHYSAAFQTCNVNCQYSCGFSDNIADLEIHEQNCYKKKKLVRCAIGPCIWFSKLSKLLQHFKDEHHEQLKNLSDPNVDLYIGAHNPVLLVTEYDNDAVDNSMYWVLYQEETDSKHVMMLYVGSNNVTKREDPKVLEYCVFSEQNPNLRLFSKAIINPGSEIDHTMNADGSLENYGTNVNVLMSDSLQLKVTQLGEFPEQVLKELECISCSKIMLNHIKLCVNGHSICIKCVSKLSNCPVCRSEFASAKNYKMQTVGQAIGNILRNKRKRVRCKNVRKGCEFIGIVEDVADHEEDDCIYRKFKIPEIKRAAPGNPERILLNSSIAEIVLFSDILEADPVEHLITRHRNPIYASGTSPRNVHRNLGNSPSSSGIPEGDLDDNSWRTRIPPASRTQDASPVNHHQNHSTSNDQRSVPTTSLIDHHQNQPITRRPVVLKRGHRARSYRRGMPFGNLNFQNSNSSF